MSQIAFLRAKAKAATGRLTRDDLIVLLRHGSLQLAEDEATAFADKGYSAYFGCVMRKRRSLRAARREAGDGNL
jgi:hypothetical protein